MNLRFSALDDRRVEEAFGVLRQVGVWLQSQGRRQRISQTSLQSYLQWQSEKANFVVIKASEIVGLVTLRLEPLDDWPEFSSFGKVLMMRALATHPRHQGSGVGAFAIRESIATLGQGQAIYLDCVSDSLPQYYAKFGFKPIGRKIKTYPDDESFDITLMRLDPTPGVEAIE